jgi:membrane protein DedA with SNARE-associated domain
MTLAVQYYLALYGYAALLPLMVIEGPAVTVLAAFLASQDLLNVWAVYAIAVLGDLIGDLLYYAAGRWTLQHLTGRPGRWATRLRQRVAQLAPRIRTRAGAMLLFGKLTHSAGFAVLLAAGAAHVSVRRFLLFNLAGTVPKSLLLVVVGYWFGRLYAAAQTDLGLASLAGFVLASSALLLFARRLLAMPCDSGV